MQDFAVGKMMAPLCFAGKEAGLPEVHGVRLRRLPLALCALLLSAFAHADVFVHDDGRSLALTNVPVSDDFVRLVREELPVSPVLPATAAAPPGAGGEDRVVVVPGARVSTLPLAADYPYRPLVRAAAERHGLPEALLHGLIKVESNFNSRAVSPKGARGLTQLMPATARRLGVRDAFDPAANIDGGARYLKELLVAFGHDVSLAIAAYNAGPGAVRRYGGIPRYAETIAYVPRVLRAAAGPWRGAASGAGRAVVKDRRTTATLAQRQP